MVEAGEIALDLDQEILSEAYVESIREEAEALGWKPTYHNSMWKGKTYRDVQKLVTNPRVDALHKAKLKQRYSKLKRDDQWSNKMTVESDNERRAIPSSYIFYYPGKETQAQYNDCFDSTNNPVRDQLYCGSCYIQAANHHFDDRYCKKRKDQGAISWETASSQWLLSCGKSRNPVEPFSCNGGYVHYVNLEFEDNGVAQNRCLNLQTYKCGSNTCVKDNHACPSTCESDSSLKITDKVYCEKGSSYYDWRYSFSEAQRRILEYGPIISQYSVYSDFYSYSSGIYQKTSGATNTGGHAVEVMGWGEENGVPVWYVKNSWGTQFGEQGFFKIKRGTTDGSDIANGVGFGEWFYGCQPKLSASVCNGVSSEMSYVCSGNGACSNNKCTCNSGWNGNNCQTKSSDPQPEDPTCSPLCNTANGGFCNEGGSSPDYCTCNSGWDATSGCNIATCNGIKAGESGVCSNHGTCSGPNTCVCDSGYSGTFCEQKNQPECSPSCNVANGGKCNKGNPTDYCTCDDGWNAESGCNTPMCNGILSTDSKVCSGRGSCQSPNNCQCSLNYRGDNCEFFSIPGIICNSIPSESESVCSSHGSCGPLNDICSCLTGYQGKWCDLAIQCASIFFFNSSVCSGNGKCLEFSPHSQEGYCKCNDGYEGKTCAIKSAVISPTFFENIVNSNMMYVMVGVGSIVLGLIAFVVLGIGFFMSLWILINCAVKNQLANVKRNQSSSKEEGKKERKKEKEFSVVVDDKIGRNHLPKQPRRKFEKIVRIRETNEVNKSRMHNRIYSNFAKRVYNNKYPQTQNKFNNSQRNNRKRIPPSVPKRKPKIPSSLPYNRRMMYQKKSKLSSNIIRM